MDFVTYLIIALALAGTLAMTLSAARAVVLERREGLPVSWSRLAAVGLVLVVALVVSGLTLSGPSTPEIEPPPPAEPLDPERRARVAELRAQIEALEAELRELEGPARVVSSAAPAVPPTWPLFVLLGLVLLAVAATLLLGRGATLVPSWLRRKVRPPPETNAPSLLDMAFAADRASFGQVLRLAERVPQDDLDPLEMLDFLYLRAIASYGLATEGRDGKPLDHQERTEKLEQAAADLDRLLERAPNMAEAHYLRARVKAARDEWDEAASELREAKAALGAVPSFSDHDLSVVLLKLAQLKLGRADVEGSTALFDEVRKIGVLAAEVPSLLVLHRIHKLRDHAKSGRFGEARTELAELRELTGESSESQRDVQITCDVYEIVLAHWEGKKKETLSLVRAFLGRWLPSDLPPVDESAADEYLEGGVDLSALPLPADLYKKLLFLQAATILALEAQPGRPLEDGVVREVGALLLRALSLAPRDRDCLAALGVLYYWFRPELRTKAVEWMESAITMGAGSQRLRRLVREAKRRETERLGLLDRFRDTASRFLMDPTVAEQVRAALSEELGRFSELQPVLISLEGSLPSREAIRAPTIEHLRERGEYLAQAVRDLARRRPEERGLSEVAERYAAVLRMLEGSEKQLAELEQTALEVMGKVVLR